MKTYSQIQEILNADQALIGGLPKLRLVVLRNITLEPIEPYLRYFAYLAGLNAEVHFGNYDNVYLEAVEENSSPLASQADAVLIFTKLETLSWGLAKGYNQFDIAQIQKEKQRLAQYIHDVLSGIRAKTHAMILWHGFEMPVYPSLGIYDSQSAFGQTAVIHDLNQILKDSLAQHSNAYFVDVNVSLIRLGMARYYDPRYWYLAHSPYTREALAEIAAEDFKYIRALKGKNKKCLVLDCDNVLWGGVVGEDGLAGIKLGKTYPGSIYYEFQQTILNLYHRGIILALCSKNNPADVWDVFQKHPDMALREEHIAAAQINWQDKATNLRQIAADLNIGLDSIVFADDSEFEINLIRHELPEVTALHLPVERALFSSDELISPGWFDTLTITSEDKFRGQAYKAEASRKQMLSNATDLDSYYRSLELVAEIRLGDAFTIPRIAQLTQKTNQFNLTTKRYSEAEIQAFVESDDNDVLCLKLGDRFGDLGIVGACIVQYEDGKALIDTFLFSCRALGRKAEEVLLNTCLSLAKMRGCSTAIGFYYPTKKNAQVEGFYPSQGFAGLEDLESEGKSYQYNLNHYQRQNPEFYRDIRFDGFPSTERI
ncbi:MAG: HAD family hydrolase [Anaerolineales bacterium]|nr:HAD family hydrolase [Anaerolineales bacterium]